MNTQPSYSFCCLLALAELSECIRGLGGPYLLAFPREQCITIFRKDQ